MQQYNVIAMTTVGQRQQQEQLRKTTIETTIQLGRVIDHHNPAVTRNQTRFLFAFQEIKTCPPCPSTTNNK